MTTTFKTVTGRAVAVTALALVIAIAAAAPAVAYPPNPCQRVIVTAAVR